MATILKGRAVRNKGWFHATHMYDAIPRNIAPSDISCLKTTGIIPRNVQ